MARRRIPPPPHAKQLTDHDYRVLAGFRRAIRGFLAFSAEGAQERGLTSQQHQALLAVRAHDREGAVSISELAEALAIKNHSAVGLVGRLVDGGYVVRRESAMDRRRVLISLTPAGAAILEEISVRNLGRLGGASRILEELLATTRALEAEQLRADGGLRPPAPAGREQPE